ncbi:hypothetical protein LGK95_20085 [Clostridium algoriphilum]|uniref:hypothetical protein n=1 Tax=Clostridium algoriphilum TaxID=198347 RepID=UPI001CF3E640|nr:hypothetical protein [Clostridium algoriphilum]MCB2295778.1 hypothetical protein [Clostridium algoriphilum]
MNTKCQYGFEQIKISDKLDEVIENAIKKAKKKENKLNLTKLIESTSFVANVVINGKVD